MALGKRKDEQQEMWEATTSLPKSLGHVFYRKLNEVFAEAGFDRARKDKRVPNEEWVSNTDPDSRIAKMKSGETHLAHKAEHVIDLDTEVVLAGGRWKHPTQFPCFPLAATDLPPIRPQETSKDLRLVDVSPYAAIVRETGLEPARPCGH